MKESILKKDIIEVLEKTEGEERVKREKIEKLEAKDGIKDAIDDDSQLEKYPQEVDYYLANDIKRIEKMEDEIIEIDKNRKTLSEEDLEEVLHRRNDLEKRKKQLEEEQKRKEEQKKGLELLAKHSPTFEKIYRKNKGKEEVVYVVNCYLTNKHKSSIKKIIESIQDSENFRQALTHTSYCNENNLINSYENLEFLGDSILNFYTSLFIYRSFPKYSEGQMSKLKQLMVQESTLAHLSREIGLNRIDENGKLEYLRLGEGEIKNQGADKTSILADVFESFVAALYLEKGTKATEQYCQAQKNLVSYREKARRREGRQQLFIMEVRDRLRIFCEWGEGKSKQEAEQKAAEKEKQTKQKKEKLVTEKETESKKSEEKNPLEEKKNELVDQVVEIDSASELLKTSSSPFLTVLEGALANIKPGIEMKRVKRGSTSSRVPKTIDEVRALKIALR
nr:12619_t:CDS:2 [Entrophospora candida]